MPTIKKPNSHFDAVLWTGDGTSSKTISSYNFAPDLVWAKNRSDTSIGWSLYDTIRGAGAEKELATHQNYAEGGDNHDTYGYLSAFTSNGFTGSNGSGSPNYYFNKSSSTYVAYGWKAGGASTVNTSGSISTNVSVNTTAGFSVVTYTGNGTNGATIGHGLGVAPRWVIVKRRNASGDDWLHYHISLGATQSIAFDINAAITSSTRWNNTAPSSTVVTLGTSTGVNASGGTYVAYCWAEVEGFSKFGSYVANASSDGPFIYTGFRPRWIMFKRTTSSTNWYVIDTSISSYNASTSGLYPNTTDAVSSEGAVDILSNGFKCRVSSGAFNYPSGETFMYAAFAESPLKYSNAR